MVARNSEAQAGASAPAWLWRAGTQAWLLVGIVLATIVAAAVLTALSGIVVPLVIAVVIGMLCRPLVDWATRHRVPPALAALGTLVLIVVTVLVLAVIVINGLVRQMPVLLDQAGAGLDALGDWVAGLGGGAGRLDPSFSEAARAAVTKLIPMVGQGLTNLVRTGFSGLAGFAVGTFFALFALFYVLKDGPHFDRWLHGRARTNERAKAAENLFEDASRSLRGYFKGTAVSASISTAILFVALLVTDTPLIGAIVVLYFAASFVPYVGAYISGAYAVLVAFSGGGPEAGLIVAATILISSQTVETFVSSWAVGSTLNLHPLVILVVTAIGAGVAGMLGMILAAPITAIIVHAVGRMRSARSTAPPAVAD